MNSGTVGKAARQWAEFLSTLLESVLDEDYDNSDDECDFILPPIDTGRKSANVMCAGDGGRRGGIRK